jgi:hypothetical protein
MTFDDNAAYTGPTSLRLTAGVRLYAAGRVDANSLSVDADVGLRVAIAQAGFVARTIPLSGDGPQRLVLLQVGDGQPHALENLLKDPRRTVAAADGLLAVLQAMGAAGYQGCRCGSEGVVLVCVAELYRRIDPPPSLCMEGIEFTELLRESYFDACVPMAGYTVHVPDLGSRSTHILRADSLDSAEYVGTAAGLTHFASDFDGPERDWLANPPRQPGPEQEGRLHARERVLREIYFPEVQPGAALHAIDFSPDHTAIGEFADLLAGTPSEGDLQRFLANYPAFLIGLTGFADSSEVAFITKPRIGTQYVADFGILHIGQGGAGATLIEIEPSTERLFTSALSPARRYQSAISQVTEWREWIERNRQGFMSDLVRTARALPMWPRRASNGSFRREEADRLEQGVWAFGGYDTPGFSYMIICGRWGKLEKAERDRLVFLNSNVHTFVTYTYDQVARQAMKRPITDY